MAFIALVILPPVAEELLFRGYLFGHLRTTMGFWTTSLVVSAAFGFIHGQWNVGIDTFILSLFLCYLRETTGSLWASMLLHGIKNGVAYFFLFIAPMIGINLAILN
jgi:membrane protease YdiL (CAAX protease family)